MLVALLPVVTSTVDGNNWIFIFLKGKNTFVIEMLKFEIKRTKTKCGISELGQIFLL